jgi:hypothetical protein
MPAVEHILRKVGSCLAIALSPFAAAHADVCEPVVRYLCDPAKDNITIGYKTTCNQELESVEYTDTENSGVYNPGSWVEVKQIGDRISQRAGSKQKVCTLSSGAYVVVLEPFIFNENPLGECGSAMSAYVTIRRGTMVLVKKTSFLLFDERNLGMGHGYCLADKEIREIKLSGGNDSPIVRTSSVGY